jgi:acetyltransferase-like isoleucine patch superfamily enzyme
VIGAGVTIGRGCRIDADGEIGERSVLSNRVRVHGSGRVELEGENWVGAGATLVAPVTLERGAVVAPGSVVTGHVPAMTIASGDPATVIGARFTDDVLRSAV